MIQVFNHYVPGRLIALLMLEALVLVLAAYVGISMDVAHSSAAIAVTSQVGIFALGMMVVMSGVGLYQPDLWDDGNSTRTRLVVAFLICFVLAGLVSHFMLFQYQRPLSVGVGIVATGLLGSFLVRAALRRWNGFSVLKPRVLVLGTGSRLMRMTENSKRNSNHEVVGYVATKDSRHYIPAQLILPMASNESLLSVARKHGVDQIVLGVRDRRDGGFPMQQLLECKMNGVRVVELSTFFEREYRQVLLDSLNPSWMILGDGFRQGTLGKVAKRFFDVVVSLVLLIATLPIMVATAICIALESGFPVFYRQERVGQGGRIFTLYKFRSMRTDAEVGGKPHWARANDDRTTRVGRFIRKYRIDELPQILNVLNGEMSFVGPRPERPFFVEQLSGQVPFYGMRHSVKPGITGWAQVRYPYGASVDDAVEKLQYDLYYVKNHSVFLDLTILVSTVEVVLWGKGAR